MRVSSSVGRTRNADDAALRRRRVGDFNVRRLTSHPVTPSLPPFSSSKALFLPVPSQHSLLPSFLPCAGLFLPSIAYNAAITDGRRAVVVPAHSAAARRSDGRVAGNELP